MCKLAAFVNLEKETKKGGKFKINKLAGVNNMLEHLFYINSYKNVDGSGYMGVTKSGELFSHKRALQSTDFIHLKPWEDLKPQLSDQFCVAMHTRYSTVGGNCDKNSHPFRYKGDGGSYTLLQNGTCAFGHKGLVAGKVSPCEVDTESVAWAFATQGVEKTLDAYEGAGVFMYIDEDANTFNVLKNYQRTLYFAKLKGAKAFVFATDEFSIEYTAKRAKVELEYVKEVSDDILHTFSLDGLKYTTKPLTINEGYTYKGYYTEQITAAPSQPFVTAEATSKCCWCDDVIDPTDSWEKYGEEFVCSGCKAEVEQYKSGGLQGYDWK